MSLYILRSNNSLKGSRYLNMHAPALWPFTTRLLDATRFTREERIRLVADNPGKYKGRWVLFDAEQRRVAK